MTFLSQIPPGTPTISDSLVAVTAGNVDRLFPVANIGLRTKLTANTNYYVTTTGNDSNPGTLAQPWATTQHAAFFISQNVDLGGFTATVNIGAGSFVGLGLSQCLGGGRLVFQGAGSSLTTLTAGPNDGTFNFGECFTAGVADLEPTEMVLHGVTLSNSGTGIGIFVPVILSLDDINFQAAGQGIATFSPCIIFLNRATIPAGTWNLIYFLSLYSFVQSFDTTTFTGNPHVQTVLQLEEYSFFQQMDLTPFTGTFTPTNTTVLLEWFSNSNLASGALGAISIGAGSLYVDPTSTFSVSPYQFQQNAGQGTGVSNVGKTQWGSFKDFTQATGYGNYFAANDNGTLAFIGEIGKFTVATLPTTLFSAATPTGTHAWVTDALAPTFGAALTGGGTIFSPAYYDGTIWRSG